MGNEKLTVLAILSAMEVAREDVIKKIIEEIDRRGNFWTNNGKWGSPTDDEMAADSFLAYKFGKVELLNDLRKFIEKTFNYET